MERKLLLYDLFKPFILAAALVFACDTATAQGSGGGGGGAANPDLALMMKWFAGEFDNYAQVWEEKETKAAHPHEHIHSIFAPISVPAFGEHVFYVKQYADGDPSKIYRQRLYSFSWNEKEKATELRIYSFPDDKQFTDAHLDPSKLAGLTPERLRAAPGCEVFWRHDGDKFLGDMKDKACRVKSQRTGKTLLITDNLVLTKDEIWINDQATDEAGNYVFGNKSGVHHKLKRARRFEGWIALRKEGTEDQYHDAMRGVALHDQGQIVPVRIPAGAESKYSVQLAQLVYQGSQTPVLKLGIIENATGQTVAYTWANPEAERIGINLRWIQAGFTLKK